jgi:hypothetical protein
MLFDIVVMVDWSSRREPCIGKDSVWIAWGEAAATVHAPVNPRTRREGMEWLRERLGKWVAQRRRVLVGFDFSLGYPAGFAQLWKARCEPNNRWRETWGRLYSLAKADERGFDLGNAVDKLAIADQLNAEIQAAHGIAEGPFWGRPDWTRSAEVLSQLPAEIAGAPPFSKGKHKRGAGQRRAILEGRNIRPAAYLSLRMTQPRYPIVANGIKCNQFRMTERRAGLAAGNAQETWKLSGTGSVGGQTLTGIPYLQALVTAPELAPHSKVWPLSEGFVGPLPDARRPSILYAEIFPSNVPLHAELPPDLKIKEARQVWNVVRQVLHMDARGTMARYFQPPGGLTEDELAGVTHEEGWILFCC